MTPEDILIADLSKGVKLRLPTAVHHYLARKTDFDIRGWELSSAKFEDKWRLAHLIMQGIATDSDIISVFAGGIIYPLGGRDPVFCPQCLNEMSQVNDTWRKGREAAINCHKLSKPDGTGLSGRYLGQLIISENGQKRKFSVKKANFEMEKRLFPAQNANAKHKNGNFRALKYRYGISSQRPSHYP